MSGYIGTKAVLLSTTAASVTGDADIGGNLTVDTSTLFVDSTNNRVGVGTASPAVLLDVTGGTSSTQARFGGTAGRGLEVSTATTFSTPDAVAVLNAPTATYGTMLFQTQSTERMRITSTGSVGIGTSSPSVEFEVSGASTPEIKVTDSGSPTGSEFALFRMAASDGNVGYVGALNGNISLFSKASLTFAAGSGERMRIDASGNLLVGKTSFDATTTGSILSNNGELWVTRSGSTPAYIRRLSTDGTLLQFNKDGTVVGRIASASGNSIEYNANGGILYLARDASNGVEVLNSNASSTPRLRPSADNTVDLGDTGRRFDDIYATNGTIQTSDANEKQQIAELTAAEMQAAKAISKLFKTFKWNDSVAEKGDAARIHTGVIAQEVEAAMTAAGLDAGRYAFFISSTWWESTEVIPAVEAVAAVEATYDEEGNILTEAVEAVEAQPERTVTHTHDTAEEAPAGAVERTRKGIRYPQLLAFIGAATEQRLASIEARLDALETV